MSKDHSHTGSFLPDRRTDRTIYRHSLLNPIRKRGPIGIPEIIPALHLSRPAVDGIMTSLKKTGLIKETGPGSPQGGRKPLLWEIDSRAGYIVGIDREAPHLSILASDLQPNTPSRGNARFDLDEPAEAILRLCIVRIRGSLGEAAILRRYQIGKHEDAVPPRAKGEGIKPTEVLRRICGAALDGAVWVEQAFFKAPDVKIKG